MDKARIKVVREETRRAIFDLLNEEEDYTIEYDWSYYMGRREVESLRESFKRKALRIATKG